MANSDNVVRLGLTPKFKDTDTLKDVKFIIYLNYILTAIILFFN